MARLQGSKGKQVKHEPQSPEEKANQQAVLEARLTGEVQVKDKDHVKNPKRVAAAARRKAANIAAGGDGCHIPLASRRKGGGKGSRQGVPDGTSRKNMQEDLKKADKVLMQRLLEMDNASDSQQFIVQKYLPKEKQQELGISINPLYEIQRMLLAEVLVPKDHGNMLKELAKYTHKQAATQQEVTLNTAEQLLEDVLAEPEKGDVIEGQFTSEGQEETS